jgi:hypothetical protein
MVVSSVIAVESVALKRYHFHSQTTNKTGNVRTTQYWDTRKISKYYVFWECVCSVSYPVNNVRKSYCTYYHLQPPGVIRVIHIIFLATRLSEKVTKHKKCVVIFSTTYVRNISHYKKNSERFYHEYWSSCKVPVILVDGFHLFHRLRRPLGTV